MLRLRDCAGESRAGADVASERLAVGGQREPPVWPSAEEGGADGGLELAGRVVEAGEGEEPSDALLGARAGEDTQATRNGRFRLRD